MNEVKDQSEGIRDASRAPDLQSCSSLSRLPLSMSNTLRIDDVSLLLDHPSQEPARADDHPPGRSRASRVWSNARLKGRICRWARVPGISVIALP
jgi:hypothetical protein